MKKSLLLLSLVFCGLIHQSYATEPPVAKVHACIYPDGYHKKQLEAKYPGTTASVWEFIKKGNFLVYPAMVELKNGKPTSEGYSTIMLFEYNCKTVKARQIGGNLGE